MKFLFIAFFISFNLPLFANYNDILNDDFSKKFSIYYSSAAASSYFDQTGKTINDVVKSNIGVSDSTPDRFLYDYSCTTIGLSFRYPLGKKLAVYADVPINFYKLEIKNYTLDSYGDQNYLSSNFYYNTKIDNYLIGMKYKLLDSTFYSYLNLDVRIPGNFSGGSPTDTTGDFLSKVPYEFMPEITLGYRLGKFKFSTLFGLDFRSNNWKNRYRARFDIAMATVPETELRFFAEYSASLMGNDSLPNFNVVRYEPFGNSFIAGGKFEMLVASGLGLSVDYALTIMGKDVWVRSKIRVAMSLYL